MMVKDDSLYIVAIVAVVAVVGYYGYRPTVVAKDSMVDSDDAAIASKGHGLSW